MILFISLLVCCTPLPELNENILEQYNLIFVGEVIHVHEPSQHWFWKFFGDNSLKYSIKVTEGYRGAKRGQVIKVTTNRYDSTGVHATVGHHWLIISNHSKHKIANLTVCGYSCPLTRKIAQKRLLFLQQTF